MDHQDERPLTQHERDMIDAAWQGHVAAGERAKAVRALAERLATVVPDEEIAAHHFGNFGDAEPRHVINVGVLKVMLGYASGHTVTTILLRHGLTVPGPITGVPRLTKRGREYARALFGGVSLEDLAHKLEGRG